ncbi:hypothetical protein CPY51_24810 [Rhizobium tubonense]|uniref:Uncharacterized protein n=1 Tax=Rhizobium tubonense TaxID=484088 RepID=A0A2W4CVQ1_9HYPH|nr:hypothetical protein CPY51_24810 [Rhizobium tubonense]
MKPQTKPFLVEIKLSRRIKRSGAKPNWLEVAPAQLAEERSDCTSDDLRQEIGEAADEIQSLERMNIDVHTSRD